MTDIAPAADAAPANTPAIADSGAELSVDEAMALYAQSEPKEVDDGEGAGEPAASEVERELASQEADAAQPEQAATGETQEADPAQEPPLDLPRSWTKEQTEHWTKLDRATQEYLLEHDRKVSEGVRRTQNEAAEVRKAAEAERLKAEEARKAYEAKLPNLENALQTTLQQEFGDIRTMQDVRKMQAEDPFRFQQWQLRQMELSEVQSEKAAAEQRQTQEKQQAWARFVQAESEAFANDTPAFKAREAEYTKRAGEVLSELGFTGEELAKLASGDEKIALYDRRLQRLLFDRIQLSEIKAAPAKAALKPLPPVQKPGAAKPPGQQNVANIQALTRRLESSGSLDDAFALFEANRRAS